MRDLGKAQPQGPQKPPDRILRGAPLAHQMIARLEQNPRFPSRRTLHRNRTVEPGPRQLRQNLRIARVRLVVPQPHHSMSLARVDHLHRQPHLAQLARQPARKRPGL